MSLFKTNLNTVLYVFSLIIDQKWWDVFDKTHLVYMKGSFLRHEILTFWGKFKNFKE